MKQICNQNNIGDSGELDVKMKCVLTSSGSDNSNKSKRFAFHC